MVISNPPLTGHSSTILIGDDRALLNWLAYALASRTDPRFVWTDVRVPGQALSPNDLLSRGLIPPERLKVTETTELAPNDQEANVAVSAVIRSDETPSNVQRLLDFLRLPNQTQRVLESIAPSDGPRVCVLSNGHRILALYPSPPAVLATVRAIVESGVALVMTFADAAPRGRLVFDNILTVEGSVSGGWKAAVATAEKWSTGGLFRTGSRQRLVDLPEVASVLDSELG